MSDGFRFVSEVIQPEDLAVLENVFRELCKRWNVDVGSADGESLAKDLFELHQAGAKDAKSLLAEMIATPPRKH